MGQGDTAGVRPPARQIPSMPDLLPIGPPAILPATEHAGDDLRGETPAQGLADEHAGDVSV